MRVAFLGLGIMGQAMAANLAKAGHEVTVWNRTPGKQIEGARTAATPAEAAQGVEVVWLCVSDTAAVENLGAWLTTVVGRICLDRLRSATVRRERYVGPWLPEPVVTSFGAAPSEDPLETVVRETPKVRVRPRRLLRSWEACRISSRRAWG